MNTRTAKEKIKMPHLTCCECGAPETQAETIHFFIQNFPDMDLDDISKTAPYRCDECLLDEIEWQTWNTYCKNNNKPIPDYVIKHHDTRKKYCEKSRKMYEKILIESMADDILAEALASA